MPDRGCCHEHRDRSRATDRLVLLHPTSLVARRYPNPLEPTPPREPHFNVVRSGRAAIRHSVGHWPTPSCGDHGSSSLGPSLSSVSGTTSSATRISSWWP